MGPGPRGKKLCWLGFCLLLAGGVAGCQKGARLRVSAGDTRRAGRPSRGAGGHRLRRFHRPDRRGRFGEYRPARDRLPRADIVQGRIGSQEGRPSLRGRPAALRCPVRSGQGAGHSRPGLAGSGQIDVGPVRGPRQVDARRREQTGAGPISSVGRRGRGPRRNAAQEPGSLPTQQGVHPHRLADQRADQPLLSDLGQSGEPGPDAPGHDRVAGSDLRLLRHGRAHAGANPQGAGRGEDRAAHQRRLPGSHGAGNGRGLSAQGFCQLRQSPGQLHHGEHHLAGQVRQPRAAVPPGDKSGRPLPRLLSPGMFVRVRMPDRPAAPGDAGHRPGHPVRPGPDVRVRGRRPAPGPIPPRHDRAARRRRPPRRHRGEAQRVGRRQRHPASRQAHGNQAGGRADAVAPRRSKGRANSSPPAGEVLTLQDSAVPRRAQPCEPRLRRSNTAERAVARPKFLTPR